jgi:RNA polymerase sigma-70 factor (sigma-E family)
VGLVRKTWRNATQGKEFDDFARVQAPLLFRAAVLITGDRGHAEDLVQTTLLRTAIRWSVASEHPQAYAYRVLINLGRDRARHLRRRVAEDLTEHMDTALEPDSRTDESDAVVDREVLTVALAQLTPAQREIIVLRFLADLSVVDTAAVLGISDGTVKSTTARATARLRELLVEPPTAPRGTT